jgi:Type IV secretory pathway, VirB3-like protein
MQTTKRGEPLPINQALNRPRAKLGLDLSAWMAILFVCVTVFLVGFRMLASLTAPAHSALSIDAATLQHFFLDQVESLSETRGFRALGVIN